MSLRVTATVQDKLTESISRFLDKHAKLISETEQEFAYSIDRQYLKFTNLKRQRDNADLTLSILPESFLISLAAQFDAYLARLLRVIFPEKPELLAGAEHGIDFSLLQSFKSIDEAREHVLTREIDRILSLSYAEQFHWLENSFGVRLKKEFTHIFPDFIEVMQHRTLVVHHNSIVTHRYLSICGEHGSHVDPLISTGDHLPTSPDYFNTAYACMYEIGVKLAHLIWRKVKPEELEAADANLNRIAQQLLAAGRYDLAIAILDFATLSLDRYWTDETRRVFVLNRAQAYKWNRQENICSLILSKDDWTGSSDAFQLAVAVLSDNFGLAIKLMEKIGISDQQDIAYKEWPLFQELRKTFEFHRAYEKIFSRHFAPIERVQKTVMKSGTSPQ